LKWCYQKGECPDCGDPIPDDCIHGQSCKNCGHVFYLPNGWVFINDNTQEEVGYAESKVYVNADQAVYKFGNCYGDGDFCVFYRKDGELNCCDPESKPIDF
jgi:hypothetical protein